MFYGLKLGVVRFFFNKLDVPSSSWHHKQLLSPCALLIDAGLL